MFMAEYLRGAADARELGIRFVALAPRQLIAGTAIGEAAAAAYGGEAGESVEDYMKRRFPVPLDPEGVARAILSIGSGEQYPEATVLTVTAEGLEVLS
jgi:hypothetical protein